MCGIAGIKGENIGPDLKKMLISIKHRGPDGSGVFVDGKVLHDDLGSLDVPQGSFGIGHNLLSIVGSEVSQPLTRDKFVLVCNGEIYNFKELKKEFDLNFKTDSDCEVVLGLIQKFYEGSLYEATKKAIKYLDGDYAFAVYDGTNFAAVRDPIGVKPLYYGKNDDKKRFAFASERKALWNIGIQDVKTLPPNQMLYNEKLIDLGDSLIENKAFKKGLTKNNSNENRSIDKSTENGLKLINEVKTGVITPKNTFENDSKDIVSKYSLKNQLKNFLIDSVEKRIKGLSKVGIIFSGGVDSTILAKIALDLGVETSLYSVGHKDSVDIKFARRAAHDMGLPLMVRTVDVDDVRKYTKLVLNAIEEFNIMKLGVGMPSYIASEMGHHDGLKVMLSGQGADELFAGYHRYLKFYEEKGEKTQEDLKLDIFNLYHVNLQRDDSVTMANSIELRVPFLDMNIINLAMDIPMKYKINNYNDNLRKCILREVAAELGVPDEIVKRPKKAAQYGSGIHKILVKKVLKDENYKNKLEEYLKY
ncbi:asparagine synthase (glutamine-hydrolyzing) [Methanobacterium paludis]|uniref:Putative asparagine synthetase [glutamine-hydrolyzing] n=1 Tax=Methanobacterium paludis (strain DSM 25820 / JCM 18151 / SWAN1) TaxID=868131 RepID=F6D3Q3_METPW|nr:asparagine synthase (glutamine-hydrolyzing) [Methanobacterium paludis]AEG18047.1 asparagine synthase (glutamine-hydrolyzing) [Methanobacterium paludis]